MLNETWRDIIGFEGLYQVSNQGNVRSVRSNHILKPQTRRHGYKFVWLYREGKPKHESIHRLVATAFCPKLSYQDEVNHINEDKADNRADNLEWCSHTENSIAGTRGQRIGKALTNGIRSKPVCQYTLGGEYIREYPSLAEVTRQLGFGAGNIIHCIQGKYSHAYGYLWSYAV